MLAPAHLQRLLARKDGFSRQVGDRRRELAERVHAEFDADKERLVPCRRRLNKRRNAWLTTRELQEAYMEALPSMTGKPVSESDVLMLMAFTRTGSSGKVNEGGFFQGAMVWRLAHAERDRWLKAIRGTDGSEATSLKRLHSLMVEINGTASLLEPAWAMEVAANISSSVDNLDEWEEALVLAIAYWVLTAAPNPEEGLIRDKLVERLRLEAVLGRGLVHFLNLLALFILSTAALTMADKSSDCRGIRLNLIRRYSLEDVGDVAALSDLSDFLKRFSTASATMAPLSNRYFDQGLELRILDGPQPFSAPQRLPEMNLQLGRSFTMHAWVQLTSADVAPPAEGLPILRRALSTIGRGSNLSCLSWNFPPSLSFGAHDFRAGTVEGPQQERAVADPYPIENSRRPPSQRPEYREYDRLVLHALVVEGTSATFYVDNATVVHEVTLPRLVTNCDSQLDTVGAEGLTLAMVTYHPTALSPHEVAELYHEGAVLGSEGYMVLPASVHELTDLQELKMASEAAAEATEANSITLMERVDWATAAAISNYVYAASPPPPFKEAAINASLGRDKVFGYTAMEIIRGPVEFLASAGTSHLSHSAHANFPRFNASKGITLSMWVKWTPDISAFAFARAIPSCTSEVCGFSQDDTCWSVSVSGHRVRVIGLRGTFNLTIPAPSAPDLNVDMGGYPEAERNRGKSLRHVAVVLNPTNTTIPVLTCIDSKCFDVGMQKYLGEGMLADCENSLQLKQREGEHFERALNQSRVFISGRPGDAHHFTGEMANMKVFDQALSESEIARLFREDPDPVAEDEGAKTPIVESRGCTAVDQLLDDVTWVDEQGHNCEWYYGTRVQGLWNCVSHLVARERCPVACSSKEVCLGSSPVADSLLIWSKQVDIRSKGPWGTMCVAKSTTPASEAIACGQNAVASQERCAALNVTKCGPQNCSAHEEDIGALLDCLGDVVWTVSQGTDDPEGYKTLPCRAILEAHEPSCDWNDDRLDEVTQASAVTGEWSMQVWFESLSGDGCMKPDIRLIGAGGAPLAEVLSQSSTVAPPKLDPPLGDGCAVGGGVHFSLYQNSREGHQRALGDANLEKGIKAPTPGERRLLTFGRLLSCGKVPGDAGVGAYLDTFSDVDCVPPDVLPELGGGRDFLRVISVMGNLRLSPINLSARMPSQGEHLLARYRGLPQQQLLRGAAPTQQEQLAMVYERDIGLFTEKVLLVSPPLLFQTRRKKQPCPWDFSNDVLDSFFSIGSDLRCQGMYKCPAYTKDLIYQCPGDFDDGLFFGRRPEQFNNDMVYVELLQSITDIPIAVRERSNGDGQREVMSTSRFIDSLTDTIEVRSVFYSPQSGIASILTVSFQQANDGLKGDFDIAHFVHLTGADLSSYYMMQAASLTVQLILVLQLVFDALNMVHLRRQGKPLEQRELVTFGINCFVAVFTVVYASWMLAHIGDSARAARAFVGDMVLQEWGSPDMDTDGKIRSLLGSFERLMGGMQTRKTIESFAMVQAIVIFVGLTMATHMHPRVALITSTIGYALSDLVHFFILFVLVLSMFAVIGTWKFGHERDDMSDILRTMWTQIDAILDPPGSLPLSDDPEDVEYIVYVILLHGLNFFLLVNFFLAIIVAGYDRYKEYDNSSDVENDILTDTWLQIKKLSYKLRYRWKSSREMAAAIRGIPSTFISIEQLTAMTDLFSDAKSAEQFNAFYTQMDALLDAGGGESRARQHVLDMESRVTLRLARADLAGRASRRELGGEMQQMREAMQRDMQHLRQEMQMLGQRLSREDVLTDPLAT